MSTPEVSDGAAWIPMPGDLAMRRSTGMLGKVVGCQWGTLQFRPTGGYIEWDVAAADLVRPTDEERVRFGVRDADARFRTAL